MSLLDLTLQPPIHNDDQLHSGLITALSFSPKGRLLATTSDDGKILVFSTETNDLLDFIEMRDRQFRCVEWVSNTRYVVGVSTGSMLVFDTLEMELKCNAFRVHRSGVDCLAHKDQVIASGAGPEIFISVIKDDHEWHVSNALLHPDFASSTSSHPIIVTSIHWGEQSLRSNSNTLLVGYVYHGISIWDVKTSTMVRTLPGTADIVIRDVSLSLETDLLVLSNASASSLDVYNMKYMSKTRTLASRPSPPLGRPTFCWRMPVTFAFGGSVIVGGRDKRGNPGVWQLSNETPKQVLDHGFNQEVDQAVSAIACHYDPPTEHAWIATATTLNHVVGSDAHPSVYLWRATKRSQTRPSHKPNRDGTVGQKAQRRRSFRRYSCYVLILFLIYVMTLAYSAVNENTLIP